MADDSYSSSGSTTISSPSPTLESYYRVESLFKSTEPEGISITKVLGSTFHFTTQVLLPYLDSPTNNFLINPLSMISSLGLLLSGSRNQTRRDICLRLLGIEELSKADEQILARIMVLANAIGLERNSGLMVARLGLFIDESIKPSPEFTSGASKHFKALIKNVDFSSNDAVKVVQEMMMNEGMENKFKNIIDFIPSDTKLMLVNAVSFEGNWQYGFHPDKTMMDQFHVDASTSKEVPFMQRFGSFKIGFNEFFECHVLALPYMNSDLDMLIFMSNEGYNLRDLIKEGCTCEKVAELIEQTSLESKDLLIQLPKFKMESSGSLKPLLSSLSLGRLFDSKHADFGDISETGSSGISLGDFVQKTLFRVSENGELSELAEPDDAAERFKVDRPFIFAIAGNFGDQGKLILLAGAVVDPSALVV